MGVSKHEWKDWADQYWTASGGTVAKSHAVLASFQATIDSLEDGDADRFLTLAGGDDEAGLHQTANAAARHSGGALDELRKLELKGNQKRFANSTAIEANETAISSVSELNFALNLLDTDLVRGLTLEREAVQADPASIAGVKDSLVSRLQSSFSTIENCLSAAEAGVAQLLSITQIGRF